MKQAPGFLPVEKTSREATPYDFYLGKFVRLDVSGGIGGTGVLSDSSRLEHGYAFSLNPAVFQNGELVTKINEPALITSNGSPVSFYPIPYSIDDFIEDRNAKKEPAKVIIYSK